MAASVTISRPEKTRQNLVRELLRLYFNIAFLMAKPQDLPAGKWQMQMGILFTAATYLLALAPYGLGIAVVRAIVDIACTAFILRIALVLTGRQPRFEQAFGGFCGASAFINLAAVPIYYVRKPAGLGDEADVSFALADFVLLVWAISLLSHIVRHTFNVRIGSSVLVAFVYFLLMSYVTQVTLHPML